MLDIGAGTGLLAMMAAKAGAPRVLAVEMAVELARLARGNVSKHALDERVRVLHCHSSSLRPQPAAADAPADAWQGKAALLVFETLGSDPLCEGLLPTLRDARERLLTFDAVVIPAHLEVYVALVESRELANLNGIGESVEGMDLSALNRLSHRSRAIRLHDYPHRVLSKPRIALRLRLDSADELPPLSGETQLEVPVLQAGTAHVVVAWSVAPPS